MTFTREQAMEHLREYNNEDAHIKHALAVEATMKYFAKKAGEDEEKWGLVGLLHDIDWEQTEQTPEKHTHLAAEWLKAKGYADDIIRAIQAHGWGITSDVEPRSLMEKTLFAVDELTGLIIAAALVRPSKSLQDLTVKSVKKKWKDKAFARGVDRDVIQKGVDLLDMNLEEMVNGVLEALRPIEQELGLGLA
ncbi:MAG: HDIG domain-containing metalloprotein [Aminobacterium sp.]|jgi:putative nucleotidyltransferase with HDIG domain|uniref:HDIG domain-containing metalloprotein n=1 Tax=unclassified Aminobacterium TaxID=2685012 RepID=UPI001BD1B500|nr:MULTISPECIES: HDIG domain-containing metalloprotein [unclassified Aminobacterium]MDD2207626.1 HDIG domain-containing protein [Aminobacterium sp.]MDD3708371.1 HDIG domain-containing protein [Aminobacterium sp.]MDD4229645.1 HDIG domain-containing protein [Aminobacterium sp.]MDD4551612.1 HDIG domain-containing protein [Aminobacterium sp.]MEA4878453.1 HDIG domain-containing protein [Aminobacterium sp.]